MFRGPLAKLLFCATVVAAALSVLASHNAFGQDASNSWRAATLAELQATLPARAAVQSEHIETEMRTASGITDGHGKFVAAVLLITAGYAADGKYSHYFVTQTPIEIGTLSLAPGEYVLGWQRGEDTLNVQFFDAATGTPRGEVTARRLQGTTRVEAFKIWPPAVKFLIQIGRFGIPYKLGH